VLILVWVGETFAGGLIIASGVPFSGSEINSSNNSFLSLFSHSGAGKAFPANCEKRACSIADCTSSSAKDAFFVMAARAEQASEHLSVASEATEIQNR